MEGVGFMPPAPTSSKAGKSKAGKQPVKNLEDHFPDWVGAVGFSEFLKDAASLASRSQASVDFGMCFKNLEQADGHIRLAGATTAPYRVLPGCKKTR